MAAAGLLLTAGLLAQTPAPTPPPPQINLPQPSPTATLKQRVGLTDIEIVYSRPGVKGRKIFGGLEPWGEVWRAGANSSTKITFSTPVKIAGKEIAAGTYGLFAQLAPDEWMIILNQDAKQWGAYTYDAKNDVVRVPAKIQRLAEPVETFTIDINDMRDDSASLVLAWENTRVAVRFEVDAVNAVVAQIDAALATGAKIPVNRLAQAAIFFGDHGIRLTQALEWMDAAIAQTPKSYYLFYHKAIIQAKAGDKTGAAASARQSIELAAADQANPVAQAEYKRLNEMILATLK